MSKLQQNETKVMTTPVICMYMTDNVNVGFSDTDAASSGYLESFVEKVEDLVANEDYITVGQLVSDDPLTAWFGFRPDRLYAIVDLLMSQL